MATQLAVLFTTSTLFSLLYEWRRGLVAGVFAGMTWLIFGMYWLVAANVNVAVIGLLWNGLGVIYVVRILVQLLSHLELRKLGEDTDVETWEGVV